MAADFKLEAGLQVIDADIKSAIQKVQDEFNKKPVTISFNKDAIQKFAEKVSAELKKTKVEMKAAPSAKGVHDFIKEIQEKLNTKNNTLKLSFTPDSKSVKEFAKKLQDEINKSDVKVEVKVDAKKAKQAASGVDEAKKKVAELTSALKEYYQLASKETKLGGVGEEYEVVAKRLEVVKSKLSELGVSAEELRAAFNSNSLEEYIQSIADVELSSEQLDKIVKIVTDGLVKESHALDQSAKASKEKAEADKAAKEAEEAAKKAAEERVNSIQKLTSGVKNFIKSFVGIASATVLIKEMYNNVVALDKAIVDLQIATGYSRDVVSGMVSEYSKLGQKLGVTTVEVAKAADSWLRQGYESREATQLITASTMLAKLGQIDMGEATDYLTSTMKGYGIAVENVTNIVDKLTSVDLVSATSAGDLAEAMQKTAVTANQVGVPLDKLIGMIATISEVSQQSASTVGTAMKSMLARMVNIKAGFLEDPETGENISNVEAALRGVGIALRDTAGNFRDMNTVLDEVAGKWDTLTNIQQGAVAVALGGTRQQENVRILMEYWDNVGKLANVAADSEGNAANKFGAFADSVEARMNALKAAWQELSTSVLSSGFIKRIIEGLTVLVNLLDKIPGSLLLISAGITKILSGVFKSSMTKALLGGSSWFEGVSAGFHGIAGAIGKVKDAAIGAIPKITSLFGKITAFVASNPWVAVIAGVVALGAAIAAFYKNRVEKTETWSEQVKREYKEAKDALAKNTEELGNINREIEEREKLMGTTDWTSTIENETRQLYLQRTELELQNKALEKNLALKRQDALSEWMQGASSAYNKNTGSSVWDFIDIATGNAKTWQTVYDPALNSNVTIERDYTFEEMDQARAYLATLASEYLKKIQEFEELLPVDAYEEASVLQKQAYDMLIERYNQIAPHVGASEIAPYYDPDRIVNSYIDEFAIIKDFRDSLGRVSERDTVSDYLEDIKTAMDLYDDGITGRDELYDELSKLGIDYAHSESELIKALPEVESLIQQWSNRDIESAEFYEKVSNLILEKYDGIETDAGARIIKLRDSLTGIADQKSTAEIHEYEDTLFDMIDGLGDEVSEEFKTSLQDAIIEYAATRDFEAFERSLFEAFSADEFASEYLLNSWKETGRELGEMSAEELFNEFTNAMSEFKGADTIRAKSAAVGYMQTLAGMMLDQDAMNALRIEFTKEFAHIRKGSTDNDADFMNAMYEAFSSVYPFSSLTPQSWKKEAAKIEPATNKDAFNSIKQILEADWVVDKQAAVDSFGAIAESLGATTGQIEAMKTALMDTDDKNTIIDSLLAFFNGIGLKGFDELAQKSKELMESLDVSKPSVSDYWEQFEKAVNSFSKASDPIEKTRAIADMIDTLAKAHLDQGVFDEVLGHILDLKAGNIDLAEFKDIIYDLAQEYPEFARYADFDWNDTTPPPEVKDVFSQIQEVFESDWSSDKDAAINKLAEMAAALEIGDTDIESMKSLLQSANLTTNKNGVIDTMISFLERSSIKNASELIKHLRDLKEVIETPVEKSSGDIWSAFEGAINSFSKASDMNEKVKAIQDIRRALLEMGDSEVADQIRVMLTHLEDGSITLETFKNQVAELVKGTEWEKFLNFDWSNVTPPPTVKDAFGQLKGIFEADWTSDKNSAIEKLAEMAESFEVSADDIGVMKSLLQDANLATNKNSVIDMIVAFLESSNIEHADELIKHLLELRDATPDTKNRAELSDDFISAIGGFKENGSNYEKNVAGGQITAAARAMFGKDSKEYTAIDGLVSKLVFGKMTLDEFHNSIAELLKGTVWENFIPQDWFKKAQDTNKLIEDLTSNLNSLMGQGSDAQRQNKFDEIVRSMSEIDDLAPEVQEELKAAMEAYLKDLDEDAFKEEIARIFGGNEKLRKYILDSWLPDKYSVKDAFGALKDVFGSDWTLDKDSAIAKLSEIASGLGVDQDTVSSLSSMLQDANIATNKNSIIDMIVRFLQSSDIEHADELIQHLLELKDATPDTKNRAELSDDFIGAVSGFNENGSKYEKNVAGGQITAAARAMFGGNSEEYAAINRLVNELVFGKMTADEFHNAIAELAKGTIWENFVPQDWFEKVEETSVLIEGLTSDLDSLMSQGSDAQRKNKFDEIIKSMSEIKDLSPDVRKDLESAMESFLEEQDEDAFKAEIVRIFSGNEELRQYILDSWLPDVKKVKTEEAIKDVVSDITSMQREDTQQGRDEYYKKITEALATLGLTAENTAGTGLFEFLQALQAGTVNGEEFEAQIYSIADALSELIKQLYGIDINLRNFLPDPAKPETLESRLATAMDTPQQIMPQYSDAFNGAKDSLMGLGTGNMITSEEQAIILQQLPQLSDEFREYAAVVADSTATDVEKRIALENLKTAFMGLYGMDMSEEFRSGMEDLVEDMEDLDEGSLAYAEGIESIADAYGIATDTARDYFDELQAAVDGSTEAWAEFQRAATEDIFANVELQGDFNTDNLLAGLYTVQDVINATGWSSEELQEKLIANGLFEEVPNTIAGKVKIPEFTVPGTGLHFPGMDIDAVYDQPLLKPTEAFQGTPPPKRGGGGGKKKSPKTGSKTSILSEQYTNDKGLYDTLIDNLKNLNNLYEEGSEEWLRNQQRIIETYQAYAKTIQDEYDRLVKAGVDMTDKEMQTLAKDLLKVNKEMYDAAKEYWEAVRDNMKESMEHIVDQMDAVLKLRDAHKDLLKEIRQENRELEKQYKIAQDEAAHPGLTEAEHEMLFSTEDYKRLTGMLKDISEQADALYEDYRNKIASVTEDETYAISYITDEYERQLGLLESQYEIAKQQLAVEKARQELQNTLRERNTAVLINGAWTWMADPDAVQAAMDKVADAEVDLEDAITDADYNRETAEIETARDAIKSSIDAMENLEFAIEDLAEGIVDLADAINEKIFNSIGTTSRNYLNQAKGHGLEMFMSELTELQETSGLVFSNSDVEKLYSLLSSGNVINSANVFDDSIVHDSAAIASILSNTANNTTNGGNVIYINGIQLSDTDSEMLLNALDRVAYTWQA